MSSSFEPTTWSHWQRWPKMLVARIINGGDAFEHPTQALIDRFAIEQLVGPNRDLHIGISGDLTMRYTTSLLALLAESPPCPTALFAAPGRAPRNSASSRPHRSDRQANNA